MTSAKRSARSEEERAVGAMYAQLWRLANPRKAAAARARKESWRGNDDAASGKKRAALAAVSRRWRRNNPEKYELQVKKQNAQRKAHPRRTRRKARAWVAANIGRVRATAARSRAKSIGRRRDTRLARYRIDKKHRRETVARVKARDAFKRRAQPNWAAAEAITAIYTRASNLQKRTGVKRHVDHIYPLKHKLFCGLHVSWNLRILTARQNISKGNRVTPGMLCPRISLR